jgi:hypothetical protein
MSALAPRIFVGLIVAHAYGFTSPTRPLPRHGVSLASSPTVMKLPAEVSASTKWQDGTYDNGEVDVLWDQLVSIYGSEAAASEAAQQVRGDVICPLFCTPTLLKESHEALIDILGTEEAAEIITKSPAMLTCGAGLRDSDIQEIRRFAAVRQVMDRISPTALRAVVLGTVGLLLLKIILSTTLQ